MMKRQKGPKYFLRTHSNQEVRFRGMNAENLETESYGSFGTPGSAFVWSKRPKSIRRARCYGSVELLVSTDESGKIKNVGRFRVEPGNAPGTPEDSSSPETPIIFENPQTETRWYYKYFLGHDHQNFAGMDSHSKSPFFFSVLISTEEEEDCVRAIHWLKTGPRKLCLPLPSTKPLSAKGILQKFPGMSDFNGTLKEIGNPKLQKDLGILEDQEGSINFKFGVVYARADQHSDDEFLGNEEGDEEFNDFLKLLGHRIELSEWGNFKGGLDVSSNQTGNESVYTTFGGHEIMFHVSTLLPHSQDNRQQVEKKRHIGNDIINIVFEGQGDPKRPNFIPSAMKSQFTHIFALVTFDSETGCYRLWIFSEESVPAFGPTLPPAGEFYNYNEFREFLLTKLINGERAAFNAQAFGEKRERTNDTLLKDMYMEYLKDSHKALGTTFHKQIDPPIRQRGSPKAKVCDTDVVEFIKLGELLRLEKLLSGEAPYTSPADASLCRKQPWEPKLVTSELEILDVVDSDSWGKHSLLISIGNAGVVLLWNDMWSVKVVEDEVSVQQLSVLETFGFVLLRCEKGRESFVCALSLSVLQKAARNNKPVTKKDCLMSRISGTKGCHLFGVTDCQNLRLNVAVCQGRRVILLRWALGHFGRVSEDANLSKNFTILKEISMNEDITAISVYETGVNSGVRVCAASKHMLEMADFSTGTVSTLCKLEDSKTLIEHVGVVADSDGSVEIILTYGNTTILLDPEDESRDFLKLLWTSKPERVAYIFPFIFAFAQNLMEVRLAINGNLLATNYMPGIKLLATKDDIVFAVEKTIVTEKTWSLYRIRDSKIGTSQIENQQKVQKISRTPNPYRKQVTSPNPLVPFPNFPNPPGNEEKGIHRQKPIDSRIAILQLAGTRGGSLGSSGDSGVGKSRGNSSSTSSECSLPACPNVFYDPFAENLV